MRKFLLLFCILSMLSGNVSSQSAWTQKADCGGGERWHAISFSIGYKGYVGLGQDTVAGYANNFWEYNSSNDSWTQKANFPGGARANAVAFSIGDKGYVGLGYGFGPPYNDFWEYDTLNDTWTQKANFPMTGGDGFFCFSTGNKGYVGKGNEIWEYDPVE